MVTNNNNTKVAFRSLKVVSGKSGCQRLVLKRRRPVADSFERMAYNYKTDDVLQTNIQI